MRISVKKAMMVASSRSLKEELVCQLESVGAKGYGTARNRGIDFGRDMAKAGPVLLGRPKAARKRAPRI